MNNKVYITAESNGFIYNMVRYLAGFLIEIGSSDLYDPILAKRLLSGTLLFHTFHGVLI